MTHIGTKILETPRLLLRPFTVEDAPAMYRNWACDPEVTKYLTWSPHGSEGDTKLFLNDQLVGYKDSTFYSWAIVLKSLGEPVGSISVVAQREPIGSIEIGYCIGRRWWHQGVTSEALAELVRFFFEEVGVNRIEAGHDIRNPNSGKVMEKCWLVREGVHRQAGRNSQGICDIARYAILRDDYFSERGAD